MKFAFIVSIILLECCSFAAHAQKSTDVVYDHALLKREYIGKNEIFTIHYRNESGKTNRINGYIRASGFENNITVYAYNSVNRNYDLIEIPLSSIQSITRSESQKTVIDDKPKVFTMGNFLKAAVIVLVSGGLALIIFHDKL